MEKIIDKYLDELISIELNKLPGQIVSEMSDPNQDKNEEWRIWNPIQSTVTDEEIKEFESRLGHNLPESYTKRASLSEMIFDGYPREYLIDTGRIPFANWSDWGLLCFDTTVENQNSDYPIVLWDHEVFDEFESKYSNFDNMIIELDKEEKENAS